MSRTILAFGPTILALALVGCATGAPATPSPSHNPGQSPGQSPTDQPSPSPSPWPSPSPSPSPIGPLVVTTPAQAAALVFAAEPRFAQIAPLRPDMVGQSAWFEAFEVADGFSVAVTLGSGDCQAGCINRHTWTYHVTRDGETALVGEEGDEVDFSTPSGTGPATIRLSLVAGPICPVEQIPPHPNCAPRPVGNAEVVLRDPNGTEVARGTSDAQGAIAFEVPAGAYWVEPLPVEGLMGTAEAQAFAVAAGGSAGLLLSYDTGIR